MSHTHVASRCWKKNNKKNGRSTSTQQADGAEQSCLCIVHLEGKQLVGEGEHQVRQRSKPSVVHLGAVQGQTVREGHRVLVRRVASADPQNLRSTRWSSLTVQSDGVGV